MQEESGESHQAAVRVPPELLDAGTLRAVLEEFATRDGFDFSDVEQRIDALRTQLKQGKLHLVFDSESESCNLVSDQDLRRLNQPD